MLGKLLKHEIKATSREYLLLYGAFLIITIFNKIFLEVNTGRRNTMISIFQNIFMAAYVLMCMTIFIVTIILIIRRFYKNLLGDEGYLMFTLPVKTYELILSKLVISLLWFVLSFVVFIFYIVILLSGHDFFREIFYFFDEYTQIFEESFGTIVLFIVMALVSGIFSILMYYLSMAGGQLIGKYRIVGAIGIYFALSFIIQILSTCIMLGIDVPNNFFISTPSYQFFLQFFNKILVTYTVMELILSAIFFVLTNYILSKRLNLE